MKSKVIKRDTQNIYYDNSPKSAVFLYDNVFGRIILKLVNKRFTSKLVGRYMNTRLSTSHITSFIKKNKIDMTEYESVEYKSFNEFFSRKIKPGKRTFSSSKNDLSSPADSKLLAYKISDNNTFIVKDKEYTLDSILRNKVLAEEYINGYFLVFRLSVDDYHRYSYIDDGSFIKEKQIKGIFNTVGPIAFKNHKIFEENQREYSILKTKNFGKIIQMEVGALLVGKIVNHKKNNFKRGEEKGYFLYGGSTVILVIKDGIVELDEDILKNSSNDIETKVKLGEVIGRKVIKK